MSRKVYVEVKVNLLIRANDDVDVMDIINGMNCTFSDSTGKADVEDAEIADYEIKDSK